MPRKLYYHLAPLRLVLYICLQMDDQNQCRENCTIIWLRFVLFYTSACKWTTRINAEKTVLSSGSASSCSIHLPANGRPESMPRKLYYHLAPLRLVLYICLQMDDQNQCRENCTIIWLRFFLFYTSANERPESMPRKSHKHGEDSLTSLKLPTD
ncbi:hypothetical protein RRG08_016103 [Elysia crispata]|uniref:Uncharacterized protein n=1 Tax=Elysia crispata TaxID=231223 RepID=A0AAE0ZQD2_9GAST|nr:hypothetical protein RRG08_016103 [Elysia crispata]